LLYKERELHLQLLDVQAESLPSELKNTLKNTKKLRVVLSGWHDKLTPQIDKYSSFVADILSHLENLESFEYDSIPIIIQFCG